MNDTAQMSFHVETVRVDAHGSLARCKAAESVPGTQLSGILRRKE